MFQGAERTDLQKVQLSFLNTVSMELRSVVAHNRCSSLQLQLEFKMLKRLITTGTVPPILRLDPFFKVTRSSRKVRNYRNSRKSFDRFEEDTVMDDF